MISWKEKKKMGKLKRRWWGRFMKLQREALDEHVDDEYHYDKHRKEIFDLREGIIPEGTEVDNPLKLNDENE